MLISDLKPNPKNPRTISDKKLSMLKNSLSEFGDLSGIVFNRKTKQIVGGHQRTKLFDEKSKIVITKTYEKPTKIGTLAQGYILSNGERFSYREVSWPNQKEKAANLAANKGAGEWDNVELSAWMKELGDDFTFDLDLTMFDEDERKGLTSTNVNFEASPNISDFKEDEKTKFKIYTCPHCEKEFEEKQAQVRLNG